MHKVHLSNHCFVKMSDSATEVNMKSPSTSGSSATAKNGQDGKSLKDYKIPRKSSRTSKYVYQDYSTDELSDSTDPYEELSSDGEISGSDQENDHEKNGKFNG